MTYRTRHLLFAALLGLLLGALAVHAVHAASRPQSTAPVFRDVQVPAAASKQPAASDDTHQATPAYKPADPVPGDSGSDRADAASTPGLILDPALASPLPGRAVVEIPTIAPIVVLRPTARPTSDGSHRLEGKASWYDWHAGEAAAGPALREALGAWRGKYVVVCSSSCITVRLTDFCGCPGGRVVDLDRRSFAQLADPSAGVIPVRVSW